MNNSYSVEAVLKATGADQFASDFDKAKKSLGGMEGATKKSSSGLKSLAGGIAKIAGGIGVTKLLSAGFNTVRNSIDGAVSRVDTLNQFPRVLEQMGYSTDEATAATERLSDGIQGLPTRLDEVVGTTQRFVTAFGDVELATESTLALNNALLASGADAQGAANATDQYVKTLSSGKLEMDTWNTLSEQMSYALSEVATDLGIADGDIWALYDSIQAGDITLEEFNQAMIDASNETGGFAETALTASGGIRTSWTNIQTAVTTGVANVIQAINDWMVDNGIGGIAEQFDKFKTVVADVFRAVVDGVPIVLDAIGGLFTLVAESTAFQVFKEVVTVAFDAIAEGVQNVIEWINQFGGANERLVETIEVIWIRIQLFIETVVTIVVDFLTTTFGALAEWWNANQEGFFEVISSVWGTIQEYYTTVFTAIADIILAIWRPLSEWYQENNELIRETIDVVWNAIADTFMNIMETIKTIIEVSFNFVASVVEAVMPYVQAIVDNTMQVILNIISVIMGIISGDWDAVWNSIKNIAQSVWDAIKALVEGAIEGVKATISSVLEVIFGVWSAKWNQIKDKVSEIWEGIKSAVSEKIEDVKASVSEGIQGALDTVTGFFDRFKEAGGNIIGNIASGISGAVGKVTGAIGNVLERARNLIPFSPPKDKTSPMVGLEKNGIIDNIAQGIMNNEGEIQRAMNRALDVDMPMVNGRISHEMNNNLSTQPAYINVNIGGRNYRAFVTDIMHEDGRMTNLEASYLGG